MGTGALDRRSAMIMAAGLFLSCSSLARAQVSVPKRGLRFGLTPVFLTSDLELLGEPPRLCRRPQLLRGWGYDEQYDEQVLT